MNKEDLKIIDYFNLSAHPEGGWYRRTYSSQETVDIERGQRLCGSSIYYFLCSGESSSLHSLLSDETWYFHFGSPVTLHLFSQEKYSSIILGNSWESGQVPQFTIREGVVFGAELNDDRGAFLSCSVCPGYVIEDFNWASKEDLLPHFSKQRDIIERLIQKQIPQ